MGESIRRQQLWTSALNDLLLAANVELESVRSGQSSRLIELRDGVIVRQDDKSALVQFLHDEATWVREGDRGWVQIGGLKVSAEVYALEPTGLTVLVTFDSDLDFDLTNLTLALDNSWLLELIIKTLEGQQRDSSWWIPDASLQAVGLLAGASIEYADRSATPKLNESQNEAINVALRHNPAFIWGPPGTGKTVTLAGLVSQLVASGERVLVIANTNVAVDTALARIMTTLGEHPRIGSGLVLRAGPLARADVREEFGELVDPQLIASRLHPDVASQRRLLAARLRETSARLKALRGRVVALTGESLELEGALRDLRMKHRREEAMVRAIDKRMQEEVDRILRQASVICTTAFRVQFKQLQGLAPFDSVLIDEASMLSLPLVWIAASTATRRVVAFGDFRQIGTIATSENDGQSNPWFSNDIFAANRIPEMVEAGTPVPALAQLTTQYRMPSDVADLVSAFAYPSHALTTARVASQGSSLSTRGLVLVDSSVHDAICESTVSNSRINAEHTRLVTSVVGSLLQAGDIDVDDIEQQLAVITPFRAQATRLRQALASIIPRSSASRLVSTVHRMQGNEREFIVLDLVEAPPRPISRLSIGSELSDKGPRVLNVAISRPTRQLIVVAHVPHMSGLTQTSAGRSYAGQRVTRLVELLNQEADRYQPPLVPRSE